tara:strand:+ start:6691 stop:6855 length:165 start_codon:yes stop_codon:yes gene_type:complete
MSDFGTELISIVPENLKYIKLVRSKLSKQTYDLLSGFGKKTVFLDGFLVSRKGQ